MTDLISNDNQPADLQSARRDPDPHGQAAMLLVESLLHGLIARSVITAADAVEIVEIATEVKEDVADSMGDTPETMQKSLTLLGSIHLSLSHDAPAKPSR